MALASLGQVRASQTSLEERKMSRGQSFCSVITWTVVTSKRDVSLNTELLGKALLSVRV